MSDWLEFLGAAPAAPTGAVLSVGADEAARAIAEARGSRVVSVTLDAVDVAAHGADVVVAADSPEAVLVLGRLAQRHGGGLVRCREAVWDVDRAELVCRAEAYGGRLIVSLAPRAPAFVLIQG